MNRLTVTRMEAFDNKVLTGFSCSGQIGKFFQKNLFFAEYSTSIEGTPESLLAIPFLATICPIAWANNADVYVETIDETFLHSLENVKGALQKMYPRMKFGGRIHAWNIVKPQIYSAEKRMMLFGGGVDSLATYIRHQTENPILLAVHGADIDSDNFEAWRSAVKQFSQFSERTGSLLRTVRSNFRSILDMLTLSLYNERISGDWWTRVMHGLALLGLCAPLAYVEKIGKIYIASSYNIKQWGSCPDIDNNVRWTGTTITHDGCELSRQDKIFLISGYIKNHDAELQIRSCYESIDGRNCSYCEKCSRTIMGLELAGINPSEHGFTIKPDTFLSIKRNLLNNKWVFTDWAEMCWVDLQRNADQSGNLPHREAQVLANWLLNFDVKTLRSQTCRTNKPEVLLSRKIFAPFLRQAPYSLHKINRKCYRTFKRLFHI